MRQLTERTNILRRLRRHSVYLRILQISLPLEQGRTWSAGSPGIKLISLKQVKQNCVLEMTAMDSQINIHTFCIIDGPPHWQLATFFDIPCSPISYAKNFPILWDLRKIKQIQACSGVFNLPV